MTPEKKEYISNLLIKSVTVIAATEYLYLFVRFM